MALILADGIVVNIPASAVIHQQRSEVGKGLQSDMLPLPRNALIVLGKAHHSLGACEGVRTPSVHTQTSYLKHTMFVNRQALEQSILRA